MTTLLEMINLANETNDAERSDLIRRFIEDNHDDIHDLLENTVEIAKNHPGCPVGAFAGGLIEIGMMIAVQDEHDKRAESLLGDTDDRTTD